MANTPGGYFNIPSQYAGSSLAQIQQATGLPFRADVLANALGVNPNTPLGTATLAYGGNIGDTGSGELQAATKLFGNPISPDQYNANQANQFIIQQNQPAIEAGGSALAAANTAAGSAYNAYQGMEPTIQGSYQNILNTITKGVNQTYASRGLSNQSPQFNLDLGTAQLPAVNAEAGALNTFERGLGQLLQGSAATAANFLNLIGQLKSGQPVTALQTGITEANQPFQQAYQAAQAALGSAQAGVAQYVSIPGIGVMDISNGQLISPYGTSTATLGAGAGQYSATNPNYSIVGY